MFSNYIESMEILHSGAQTFSVSFPCAQMNNPTIAFCFLKLQKSLLLMIAILLGCSGGSLLLENASTQYKHNKGYTNLETICNSFHKGMRRTEVEHLLGEPDYSPIKGQYYYSSDRSVYLKDQGREVSVGLVVDYRDMNGNITETLQEFWLGPIGE